MAYHCSNCRETLAVDGVKKISIGQERNVVFCASCNCYVTLEEPKAVAKASDKKPE